MISMEDSSREFSYSKKEEMRLKIFQFSKRWDSVEKRTFLLKIILLTENFSTENQHRQDPFQASHIPGSAPPFCCLEEPPARRCQVPSTGSMVARPGRAGETELLLAPSARPKRSEQGHVRGGCSGAHGGALSLCCLSQLLLSR